MKSIREYVDGLTTAEKARLRALIEARYGEPQRAAPLPPQKQHREAAEAEDASTPLADLSADGGGE